MSTPITVAQKNWIDNVSYRDLLYKIRFAPVGDPMVDGDTGEYLLKVQRERRAAPGGDVEHVRASKDIGDEVYRAK
jgi:hypothetical protein